MSRMKNCMRIFQQPVREQPHAGLADGLPGEVALHLALVRAEVGELQEEAADRSAPQRVFRGRVHVVSIAFILPMALAEGKALGEGGMLADAGAPRGRRPRTGRRTSRPSAACGLTPTAFAPPVVV